jgi:hypothetical protein
MGSGASKILPKDSYLTFKIIIEPIIMTENGDRDTDLVNIYDVDDLTKNMREIFSCEDDLKIIIKSSYVDNNNINVEGDIYYKESEHFSLITDVEDYMVRKIIENKDKLVSEKEFEDSMYKVYFDEVYDIEFGFVEIVGKPQKIKIIKPMRDTEDSGRTKIMDKEDIRLRKRVLLLKKSKQKN